MMAPTIGASVLSQAKKSPTEAPRGPSIALPSGNMICTIGRKGVSVNLGAVDFAIWFLQLRPAFYLETNGLHGFVLQIDLTSFKQYLISFRIH
jgi:hypothetical protein